MRAHGARHLGTLEVFYQLLLLGFQGRYRIDGPERLGLITARLGEELRQMRGHSPGFSPHGAPPDRIVHALRRQIPLWAPIIVFIVASTLAYGQFAYSLDRLMDRQLSAYEDLVSLPAQSAHITITLP